MIKAISYTLVFVGIQLLASSLVGGILMLTGHSEWLSSPYTAIATMVLFSLTSLLVFILAHWAVPTKDYLVSRPWAVVFWSVLAALGVVLPSIWMQEHLPELPNLLEAELGELMSVPGGYFVVCLAAPLVEELVMRGAVLRSLLEWKPEQKWGMIAISALFFAAIHMNPAQMLHAFLMGLLLGWMYMRTSSIVPGVAFHWANNTVAYLLYRAYPDPKIRLVDILGSEQRSLLAVAFSLCILLPALYQLYLRLKKA